MNLKEVAPVKRIGAVSPAARDTVRITPVRIPLNELGRTIVRIACQRLAPRFQHASRKACGTAPKASLVLVTIRGKFITAIVREAVRRPACHLVSESFGSAKKRLKTGSITRTNAPSPKRPWTMLGTPA